MGKNQAVEKAEYFAESIGRMAYQALLEEVYTVPKPGLVDPYSCGAHTDMDVQTFERSAEALYPWFVRMAYQGYQLTCTPEDLFREIRKTGMLAEEAMYRATGHVNTHKSRTIRDYRDSRGSACRIPICFSYCASGTGGWTFAGNEVEPDQITDPFCTDEPGAGFQHFIEKESVSTLSGTDGSDAVSGGRRSLLRRCVRQTDPHGCGLYKAWYQRRWVCRSTCHLTVSCDAVQ